MIEKISTIKQLRRWETCVEKDYEIAWGATIDIETLYEHFTISEEEYAKLGRPTVGDKIKLTLDKEG